MRRDTRLHPALKSSQRARASSSKYTPAHTDKIRRSNRISKEYPTFRKTAASRGLSNSGNQCYRLAPLQALLHLPKFANLVEDHNILEGTEHDHRNKNPHRPSRPRSTLSRVVQPYDFKFSEIVKGEEISQKGHCPACMLKDIIVAYWRGRDLGPSMRRFHQFGDSHADFFEDGTLRQGDAKEFLEYLLNAVRDCADNESPDPQILADTMNWHADFAALFHLDITTTRSCSTSRCPRAHETTSGTATHHFGFEPIDIDIIDYDDEYGSPFTLPDAIRQQFNTAPANEDEKCTVRDGGCGRIGTVTRSFAINAAPEYLCIPLQRTAVPASDPTVPLKIRTAPQIPELLDLTEFTVGGGMKLRYRIRSVVAHEGATITEGHYIALVRRQGGGAVVLDDSVVENVGEGGLRDSPAIWGEGVFDVYVLFYERIEEEGDGDVLDGEYGDGGVLVEARKEGEVVGTSLAEASARIQDAGMESLPKFVASEDDSPRQHPPIPSTNPHVTPPARARPTAHTETSPPRPIPEITQNLRTTQDINTSNRVSKPRANSRLPTQLTRPSQPPKRTSPRIKARITKSLPTVASPQHLATRSNKLGKKCRRFPLPGDLNRARVVKAAWAIDLQRGWRFGGWR